MNKSLPVWTSLVFLIPNIVAADQPAGPAPMDLPFAAPEIIPPAGVPLSADEFGLLFAIPLPPDAEDEPDDAAAFIARGRSRAEEGDFDQAIEDFSEAIQLEPDNVPAYLARGRAYAKKGDFSRAIAEATAAIRLEPDNPWPCADRSWYLIQTASARQAIEDYAEAIRLQFDRVVENRRDRAIEKDTETIRQRPDNASAYRARGCKYHAKHDYRRAIEDFTQVVRLEPEKASSYLLRSLACAENREFDKAIDDVARAIRIAPKSIAPYGIRGVIYAKMDRHKKAIEDFTTIIRLEPDSTWAYINRAESYAQSGRRDRAIEDYTSALRLDPEDVVPRLSRAALYAEKGELDKAIEDCSEVIRLEPDNAFAFRRRGGWFAKRGDHEEAIDDFTEAIRLDPKDAAAWHGRAWSYKKIGCPDLAREDLAAAYRLEFKDEPAEDDVKSRAVAANRIEPAVERIVSADQFPDEPVLPDFLKLATGGQKTNARHSPSLPPLRLEDPAVCMRRADSFAGRGDYFEAIQGYSQAIMGDPLNAHAYYCRGQSYEAQGNWYRALADYSDAVRLGHSEEKQSARSSWNRLADALRRKWAPAKLVIVSVELDEPGEGPMPMLPPCQELSVETDRKADGAIKVRHSAVMNDVWIAPDDVKEKVLAKWPEIETALIAKIDKTPDRSCEAPAERKQRETVIWSSSFLGLRVVRVDYYRNGKAKLKIGDETIEAPFEFRHDAELRMELAK